MDSVTQAALGAAIGQAGFRRLGRRAALFGAICGTIPDLDSLVAGSDPWTRLEVHRGLSHSLLFLPLLAIPVGWLGWRLFGRRGTPKDWMILAFWGLMTHPILDTCTTYGTQLFAPFSSLRVSMDTVGIIDLIYTLPLLIALFIGSRKSVSLERAQKWARGALTFGCLYLLLQFGVTQWSLSQFVQAVESEGGKVVDARAPAPALFPVLRHGVARLEDGRIVTSTLVPWAPDRTELQWIESDSSPRIKEAMESRRGAIMRWFSDEFISSEIQEDGSVIFQDHRYGRITNSASSVFQFVLPAGNAPDELARQPRSKRKGKPLNVGDEGRAAWRLITGDD